MTKAYQQRHGSVYNSAIDRWIVVLLLLSPVTATGIGLLFIAQGHPDDAAILFLIAAGTLLVTLALTLPCRYTILADALSVRCGLIFYQISLSSIVRVEPSNSLRSGPALSLRRVLVATDKRNHLLSPKDRDAFIAELNDAIEKTKTV